MDVGAVKGFYSQDDGSEDKLVRSGFSDGIGGDSEGNGIGPERIRDERGVGKL